jgi:cyclic-di-GMP-binding protein
MPDNSFDIISEISIPEVENAINQALKEIVNRYDLKDAKAEITLQQKDNKILLSASDDFKLKAVRDVLESKLIKRQVPLKGLIYGTLIQGTGQTMRQEITLQQGIPIEKARDVVKFIKDSKKKVQASINGELVRVSSKDRDSLQEIIAALRGHDFGIDMQFTNFRSN